MRITTESVRNSFDSATTHDDYQRAKRRARALSQTELIDMLECVGRAANRCRVGRA